MLFIFKNAALKPIKDKRGFGGSGIIRVSVNDSTLSTTALEDYLKTLEEIVTLELDSVIVQPHFKHGNNSKNQKGYETFLDLSSLENETHVLTIKEKYVRKDSLVEQYAARIPFWYYPS